MATKQKAIKVCDVCGIEIPEKTGFYCDDVPNEGYSSIWHNGKSFEVVEGKDFCSLECLVSAIKKELSI